MKSFIRLRDHTGRIIGTARVEADKTLSQIIGDIAVASGLVWIAVELAELAATLLQMLI